MNKQHTEKHNTKRKAILSAPVEFTAIDNDDYSTFPEEWERVLIAAYNKSLNRTTLAIAMYQGKYGHNHTWLCILLTEDKIDWYTLDQSWTVTHWSSALMPETIERINKLKKEVQL